MASPVHEPTRRPTRRIRAGAAAVVAAAAIVAACAPPSRPGAGDNPSGAVDSVELGAGTVTVSGWASDANSATPIEVMFWVDGRLRPDKVTALLARPDVAAATGHADRGFATMLAVPNASTATLVCVSALNVGAGASAMLGCRRAVTEPSATTVPPTTTAPPPPPWLSVGGTGRASIASDGTQGDDGSDSASVSADGRYVAFVSTASNLVAGDTNDIPDVFVRDTTAGTTTRVSVASDGTQGDDSSDRVAISADGRYVAFRSAASNLVAGDTNGSGDVFVRDTIAGTTTRVSVASDGAQSNFHSYEAAVSADGRYVAFMSGASNLVAGDTNGRYDVFVRDTIAGTTTRVSVAGDGSQGDGHSYQTAISADGRYVAFLSGASNLAAGDTNGRDDIFVRDTIAGTTTRASVASDGTQGNDYSDQPSLSSDGRYVAFRSAASNLVAGDTNGRYDVFVRDTTADTTTRVSVASDGTQGNDYSDQPSLSSDGRYVAFASAVSNLVAGDTNGRQDVFVRDTTAGTTTRVSVASDGTQGADEPDGHLGGLGGSDARPVISGDGRYVVFTSTFVNLVASDTNGRADVFMHRIG